jgi:hypothetical protein
MYVMVEFVGTDAAEPQPNSAKHVPNAPPSAKVAKYDHFALDLFL